MGMKGQKIAIGAGVAVAVLLCLGGAWIAWRAFASSAGVREERNTRLKQLQSIYKKDPFPSATNVVVVRRDRQRLDGWTQDLGRELRGSLGAATNVVSPSLFIQQLQQVARELRNPRLTGGVALPEGFAFGFERYLGTTTMPGVKDVPRLALQLHMVNAMLREILAARVSAVTAVERDQFEDAAAAAPAAPAPGSGRGRHGPAAAAPAGSAAAAPAGPYARQRFSFAFTAGEKSLDEVLDRLAAMPLFVVVADLAVQREDQRGLRPAPEKAADADKNKPAPDRRPRVVSGPEISPLLKVRMQVDVYTFEGV
jgi:hypothetical protein